MVTIRRVEVLPFAIPLAAPLHTARGPITHRRGVVIRLHTDGGACGIGEAAPHPAAPAAALGALRAALAGATRGLTGADAARLDELAAGLDPVAASGLDMALHDLVGRVTDRPVCALLGGARRDVVPVSALLAAHDCGARAAAAGFTHAKIKVGPDLAAARAHLAAIRRAAPGLQLRADANGCWSVTDATAAAHRLAPLEWLEQPVDAADVAGMATVRRAGAVPIAADEAVSGPAAVARLAAAGAADVAVIKLVQVGGLARARATAAAASAAGMALAVTTAIDTGIATAAALHLAAALPDPPRACGLATASLLAGDLLRTPIAEGPAMRPPAGAGLGVTLDLDALARFRDVEAT